MIHVSKSPGVLCAPPRMLYTQAHCPRVRPCCRRHLAHREWRGSPHHQDPDHHQGIADLRRLRGPASASTRRSSARRYGEIDPTDPKNAVIVDIQLAPRNASGKVEYSYDFYILKPIDLTKGEHKVMYEPPNRGRKTGRRSNRVRRRQRPGLDDRPDEAAQLVPDAARLHDGVQRLGLLGRHQTTPNSISTITFRSRRTPDGSSITGPGVRVHREPGRVVHAQLSGRHAGPVARAKLTHRVKLNDTPQRGSGRGLEVQRRRHARSACCRRALVRRQRHLRVHLHRQGSDGERPRLRRRARLERVPAVRDEGRRRHGESAGRRRHAHLHRDLVAARAACSTTSATSASTRPRTARRCSTA